MISLLGFRKLANAAAATGVAALAMAFGLSTAAADTGASVAGGVKFDGPRPERHPIQMQEGRGRQSDCEKIHSEPVLSQDQIVSESGDVANVFVYVKSGVEKKDYPLPEEPAVLDQHGCLYVPHIQGVRVGQKLVIRNSDQLMHNVRSYPKLNRGFNIGQPAPGDREKEFHRAEAAIKIKCDIHKWMEAYIFALDHPFFGVTAENGKFEIKGLPAGEYTLAAWHEVYGELTQDVKVGESGSTEVNFTFKPAAE